MNCEVEDLCCNINCGLNGSCNPTEGKCDCKECFSGEFCEIEDLCCYNDCNNQGTCQPDGSCSCDTCFEGPNCEDADLCCHQDCGDHGTCDKYDGQCNCQNCYSGNNCEIYDLCCEVDCGDHGSCLKTDGTCQCQHCYTGKFCETLDLCCDNDCSGNGNCSEGICTCNAGFSGDQCQNQDLCFGVTCLNGECNQGYCLCHPGWSGLYCDNRDWCHDVECNNGYCAGKGKCFCLGGWKGDYCDQQDFCYRVECNSGTCDETNGSCYGCAPGFSGSNCEIEDKCHGVTCGRYGECDANNGQCNRSTIKASLYGDVHYTSWDGRVSSIQGHCNYQLAGFHNDTVFEASNLPWFRFQGRNEEKPDFRIKEVTFLHGWKFEWKPASFEDDDEPLVISWDYKEPGRKVNINGKPIRSPYIYEDFEIQTEGMQGYTIYFGITNKAEAANPNNHFIAKIKFGLNDHWLDFHLDGRYADKISGLFGTANQDKRDDQIMPDGSIYPGSELRVNSDDYDWNLGWGNNWLMKNNEILVGQTCPEDTPAPSTCSAADKVAIASMCDLMKHGAFGGCTEDLEDSLFGCNFDLCMLPRDKWQEALCQILSKRESDCLDSGFILPEWRSPALCPVTCGPNQRFNFQAPGCVSSIWNCQPETALGPCQQPNDARCECLESHPYWNGNECVAECPPFKCLDVICEDGECDPETGLCISNKILEIMEDSTNEFSNALVCPCVTFLTTTLEATWDQAKDYCESKNLKMATVRNTLENKVLSKGQPDSWLASRRKGHVLSSDYNVFINVYDGSEVCSFWSPWEPNNFGGSEECVQIYYGSRWNDLGCQRKLSIVCEDRICVPDCDGPNAPKETEGDSGTDPTIPPSTSSILVIPPNVVENAITHGNDNIVESMTAHGANCVTYFKTNLKVTWQEGIDYCESVGLAMAATTNQLELRLLNYFTSNDQTWLRAQRTTVSQHSFEWSETFIFEALPISEACSFWNVNEPNNHGGVESCICTYGSKWNDVRCSVKKLVVCERRTCVPNQNC